MGVFAAILTGLALGIIGPGWTMFCAMIAFLLGNILLAIAQPSTTYWGYIFVANVIMPVGLDVSQTLPFPFFPYTSTLLSEGTSVLIKTFGLCR